MLGPLPEYIRGPAFGCPVRRQIVFVEEGAGGGWVLFIVIIISMHVATVKTKLKFSRCL